MSYYYMKTGEPIPDRTYDGPQDKRTKQAFKDECDINRLLQRATKEGALSHLEVHGAEYGEFANYDYHEAMTRLAKGREIFAQLPSEIRNEFQNDPGRFFSFVNAPENVDRLPELFPALARPGRYQLDVSPSTPPGATIEPAGTPEPAPEPTPAPEPDPA